MMVQLVKGVKFFRPLHNTAPAASGLTSLDHSIWQVGSFCILHGDVPDAEAVGWLNQLPDNETMIKMALMHGIHDHGAVCEMHNYLWLALAHEKVGLHAGALRICALGLETEPSRGGTPSSWDMSAMHGCTGRVLSKLGRKTEALAAFNAGVWCSRNVDQARLFEENVIGSHYPTSLLSRIRSLTVAIFYTVFR